MTRAGTRPALGILNRFLPEAIRSDVHAGRRGRLLVAAAFGLAAALALGLALRLLIAPLHPAATAIAVATVLLFAAVPWLTRTAGSLRLGGALVIGGFLISLLASGLFIGGLEGPALVLAPLVPLVATFLQGPRAGVVTALVLVAATVLFAFLPSWGVELPPSPLAGASVLAARALMLSLTILLVTLVAVVHEKQRNDAERRLATSQELYRQLFQQSKDVVALTARDGRLLDVNQAGVELYGFASREAMLSRYNAAEFYVDPEERRVLLDRLRRLGYVKSYESRHRTLGGEVRILQGTTSVIRDDDDNVEFLLAILRDVTDERRITAERERALAELEEKNRELERFTSTVSHDLKSPLLTIQGFLELVERSAAAGDLDRMRRDVAMIRGAADAMRRLIDDLLELARIRRGPLVETSLATLASEVAELLAGRITQEGVKVTIDPGLPRVAGDPTLLRLVFQNLIDNAVKAVAGRPDPRVEVGWRRDDGEPVVTVADNGVGIAAADRERVFGLFEKLDPESEGTGLGLASVRRAVEAHGGRIWVESAGEGRGATFCFTLAPQA